jgi:two-component system sensor histidine kinase UhpB
VNGANALTLRNKGLVLIGIVLSILFWFLEAVLHVLVFDGGPDLTTEMFAPPLHEVWMRLTIMAMFILFGVYAQRSLEARRRAELVALQAKRELEQIFETAADGMRVVDRNYTVLQANETFAGLVGMPKEAIVGRKCYEVFRGAHCDTPGCPLVRVVDLDERVEYDAEKERPDGGRVPCIVTATPFRHPNGEILGIVEDFKDISERRRWESELMESRERLQELTAHLQDIREEERSRIAREIHDELGQALTALNMDLHWLRKRLPEDQPALLDKSQTMVQLIAGTVQSVRRICSELRPGILDDFGLAAAIEWQAEEFSKRTGIDCDIVAEPADLVLDENLSITIFRILQEALTNVARHAEATHVEIVLSDDSGMFEMRVCDNGKGLLRQGARKPKSFGLIGIRERVREYSGHFKVSSRENGGTCVEVRIPTGTVGAQINDKNFDRRRSCNCA